MDTSQSSSAFSESPDVSHNDVSMFMDSLSYESLKLKTKSSLCINVQKEASKTTFFAHFTSLIKDCAVCITQSLQLAVDLLLENSSTCKFIEYIEDAICMLQMLSNYLKNVIESVSMSCGTMEIFPITTGNILLSVFRHCKESELIYGKNLVRVGKQLKDLFRACHELQLTYLMILEKHFIFDLAICDEERILIDVLQINLKIGEIVQSLDVKTMAEQWKAYTMICEKYSSNLMNTNIYNECSIVLCDIARENMANALEINSDEKVAVRSLKVTSFIIKILLKVTNIFKHTTSKKHNHVIELLIYIYLNNESYLKLKAVKSNQLIDLMKGNVSIPTGCLLTELLSDASFGNSLDHYDVDNIKMDDRLLGYVVLIVNIIKEILKDHLKHNYLKLKLVSRIFDILPYCHVWFNMGLQFESESINSQKTTYGLYELLLTHTTALTATLSSEDMNKLEIKMFEAVLDVECSRALFFSNLWTLLARLSTQQFLQCQMRSLCNIYQKLEKISTFTRSPQLVHLSYTITRLFELMENDDKMKIFRQFNPIDDERNISLWIALRIANFPLGFQTQLEDDVMEKCRFEFNNFFSSNLKTMGEIRHLIKLIRLLSTFSTNKDDMEETVITAWTRACMNKNKLISRGPIDASVVLHVEYIKALCELTLSMTNIFAVKCMNLIKVFHTISSIVQKGTLELKLVIIEPLCKMASLLKPDNRSSIERISSQTFKRLFEDPDTIVKSKLFCTLHKYMRDMKIEKIISLTVSDDVMFKEQWTHFLKYGTLKNQKRMELKEQLKMVMEFEFSHKCIELKMEDSDIVAPIKRDSSSNFDIADIDELFDNECDGEPKCKKLKVTTEVDEIISRIEHDTSLLCKIKENFDMECKKRIRSVYEKLRNIVD